VWKTQQCGFFAKDHFVVGARNAGKYSLIHECCEFASTRGKSGAPVRHHAFDHPLETDWPAGDG
jgi:hypothetical protein